MGPQSRFLLFDGQGSARAAVSSSGAQVGTASYSAWGAVYQGGLGALGWKGRFGQYRDAETGLIHCRARYYAPALGRFASRDPVGFSGGVNLYAYCGADPVNFADPSGLSEGLGFLTDVVAEAPRVAAQAAGTAETGVVATAVEVGTAAGLRSVALRAAGPAGLIVSGASTFGMLYDVLTSPDPNAQPAWLASHPEQVQQIEQLDSICQNIVLVDSNAIGVFRKDPSIGGRLRPGETPLVGHLCCASG